MASARVFVSFINYTRNSNYLFFTSACRPASFLDDKKSYTCKGTSMLGIFSPALLAGSTSGARPHLFFPACGDDDARIFFSNLPLAGGDAASRARLDTINTNFQGA